MVDARAEVRRVRRRRRQACEAGFLRPPHEADDQPVHNGLDLLADGQHVWRQLHEVVLHRLTRNLDDVLRQRHASVAELVLLLEDALVRRVLGHLGAARVEQLVLGPQGVVAAAREELRRAARAEERVLKQHGLLVAVVQVLCQVLRGDHHGPRARLVLEQLLRQVERDDVGGAAHAAQVVATDVLSEMELVADHRAQRRRGREDGAVHDQEVDLLGLHARPLEQVAHEREDD
mmetsp:Transcript_42603/g.110065  ORF Transcript_42603/g.110065 Transcript_42603/m.110065 type:complete len:233 (-) Transcript_42603:664-1362(-)